ncbi:MAG: hypothetical protein QOF61_2091, partial [Acidobacteriota bacterium]|nr:hypothetical protein [Acidobacteriota bacterium]
MRAQVAPAIFHVTIRSSESRESLITETTTARDTRAALPSTAGGFAPRARPDARVSFNSRASLLRSATVRAVAACVLIGFAVRLLLVACVESVLSPDGVVYAGLARQLAAGNLRAGLSSYYPPLYPLLIALSSLVFRDVEFAGRFVSVAAGALLIVPVYLLAREWYGHRVARLAAIVIALHPLLIYYSSVLLTESTYTLLFTCGVLAGWRA